VQGKESRHVVGSAWEGINAESVSPVRIANVGCKVYLQGCMITSFRKLVLAELQRAQRLIARVGVEIDPQFRIATPDGDYWIALTLPNDEAERFRRLALVTDFMALKCSPGFVLATEIREPDAVVAIGVTHAERIGVLSRIGREPLTFGQLEWLDETEVGEEVSDLLPCGLRDFSDARIAEIESLFGADGEFPAMKIERRVAGGVGSPSIDLS
jgi:hypothetical protein